MPMSFTPAPPDRNEFDIAKFVWERKDATATQKQIAAIRKHLKEKWNFEVTPAEAYQRNMHDESDKDHNPIIPSRLLLTT